MNFDDYLRISQVGIETAVWVSAPILIIGLVAGLAVSIFQAATQINDSALAFIPKICAAIISLLVFGNFMVSRLAWYTKWVFEMIPSILP